jgi:hypothetical protein
MLGKLPLFIYYFRKELAASNCFGIHGTSSTQAIAIRALYPSGARNYFISNIMISSSSFSSTSYNMGGKIDTGISLKRAFPITTSKIAYLLGNY